MSFSENLKQIRKEHHLSQEELAELLDVSRQAVSKWEQGQGYPEVEKLLLLSSKLNISLDALMSNENGCDCGSKDTNVTGSIVITSPHENVIATCYKVAASGKMRGGKNLRSIYCSVLIEAVRVFGENRLRFWGGMPAKNRSQKKLQKFIRRFCRATRLIRCNIAQKRSAAGQA